jgi:hypothetical protein
MDLLHMVLTKYSQKNKKKFQKQTFKFLHMHFTNAEKLCQSLVIVSCA